MDCFSVHVSYEVPCFKSCFMCRSTIFYVLITDTRDSNIIITINFSSKRSLKDEDTPLVVLRLADYK